MGMANATTTQNGGSGQQGSSSSLIAVTAVIKAVVVIILVLQLSGAVANVNTTTATLLVIMVLVAIIPFSLSINFPGGGGFTLKNTSAAAAVVSQAAAEAMSGQTQKKVPAPIKIINASGLKVGQKVHIPVTLPHVDVLFSKMSDADFQIETTPHDSPPPWKALVGSNPALGIAAMRYEIEIHLRGLASAHSIPIGLGGSDIRFLVRSLGAANALTPKEQEAILAVTDLASQAVHARRIDAAAAEKLSQMGDDVLYLLRRKGDGS